MAIFRHPIGFFFNRLNASKIPHVDAISRKWSSCGLRSEMSKSIYSVGDGCEMEEYELPKVIKVETQFLPRKGRTTVFFKIRREDLFSDNFSVEGKIDSAQLVACV